MTEPERTPPPPAGDDPHGPVVRFFESTGAGARTALEPLAEALRAAGAAVELLAAIDQDDVWLLIARGGDAPSAPHVPTGVRRWRFRSVAA